MGTKNLATQTHFISSLRPTLKEEKMSEDERRRSKLPGDVAEDNPILDKPRSRKEKAACRQRQPPRASQGKTQVQRVNHRSMEEEQFKEKLTPPH